MRGDTVLALIILAVATVYGETTFSQSPTPIRTLDVSKIDFNKISEADINATIRHQEELRSKAKEAAAEQAAIIATQTATLDQVKASAAQTTAAFNAYQLATETTITKANQAIAALQHVLKKLHLAKWILCGVWLALCGMVALKIPPPIGLYAGGGLAVAGITFIWLWI